eukprot:scaffold47324_cov50-Phaeocystis_antarctica.AAC.1
MARHTNTVLSGRDHHRPAQGHNLASLIPRPQGHAISILLGRPAPTGSGGWGGSASPAASAAPFVTRLLCSDLLWLGLGLGLGLGFGFGFG